MQTISKTTRVGAMLVAGATMLAATGCEPTDWTNPEHVSRAIREGDPFDQRAAIQKVSELPDDQEKAVIPALVEVYMGKGPNQKDAMELLVQYRDVAAKDAYLAELQSNETGYAGASARALGHAGAEDAIPKMLEILKTSDKSDVKVEIIQALGFMPKAEVAPPLLDVLRLDVDAHPIQLHTYACETLGKVALANPDAITDEIAKEVTLAMYYGNMAGQSLDRDCGLAVQRFGAKAVPHLLAIFKGEREDVQKLMAKYDSDKSPFPPNRPKLLAGIRLTTLRAQEAIDPFVEELRETKEAPKELQGDKAVHWRMTEGQITSEVSRGLGDLGAVKGVETLEAIVKGDYVNEEWDEITDGIVELQLRQDAGFALKAMGNRGSVGVLLQMAEKGVIVDLERRNEILAKRGQPEPEVRRYQFNWMTFSIAAALSDGSDLDKFDGVVQRTSNEYPELGKKMGEYLAVVQLAKECHEQADDAGKAKCFVSKLKDNRPEIREKAALELGWLPAEVGGPAIEANLGVDFVDTREMLENGLYRFKRKESVKVIEDLLDKEANRGGVEHRLDQHRLRLLHGYLSSLAG